MNLDELKKFAAAYRKAAADYRKALLVYGQLADHDALSEAERRLIKAALTVAREGLDEPN